MKHLKLLLAMILVAGVTVFIGCSDDDEPAEMTIETITGTGTDLESGDQVTKDLNAASAATDVPLDVVIEITFSKEVDAATVTSSTVTLSSSSGDVGLGLDVSGTTITVTPDGELERGTDYELSLTGGVVAADGGKFTAVSRTFTTAGKAKVEPPQKDSQVAYWNFNENTEDQVGDHTITNNTQVSGYVEDRFGYQASCGDFNGEGDIVEVGNPGDLISPSMTISYWFKISLDDPLIENNFFMLGLAAERGYFCEVGTADFGPWIKFATSHKIHPDADNNAEFATAWGDAVNGQGGGASGETLEYNWEGDLAAKIDGKWTHLVMTFDHSNSIKRIYLNGEEMRRTNLSANQEWWMIDMAINSVGVEETIDTDLGVGYGGSTKNKATGWADYEADLEAENYRTFSGQMDDLRIFNVALTKAEVSQLYNDESP